MAKTYQEVQELTLKTVSDITKSPEEWMLYLDTAARMYRYSFQEQMLIHAQRPDATACASYELWQRRFNRVVMRGRKGIALIDTSAQRPKLKYVFDIGDTIRRPDGTTPKLWSIPPAPEHDVVQGIADRFQAQPEYLTLDSLLHTLAIDATIDEMDDAMTELMEHTNGSFLEGLDEGNLSVRFRYTMDASLEYMLLARCGFRPRDYFGVEDFRYIAEFNTIDTLTVLGNAVSEQANVILTAIGQITRQMRQENTQQKTSAEALDKQGHNDYYTLKHESEPQNQSEMQGGQDHGDAGGVPRGDGRDALSEPDDEGAGGLHPGQVRSDAQAVSGAAETEPVSGADPEGRAVGASGGRGQERPADGGSNCSADGGAARRERADEGRASDGVGATDEQLHPVGAGDRDERPDLSVSAPAPETQPNIPEIRPDGTELSGLDVSSEVTDAFLRAGGNQRHSVLRIIAYHQLQGADFPGFLRQEFCGNGMRMGGRGLIVDGQLYAAWFDLEGIHVAKGTTVQNPNAALFTWEQAANRIASMLNQGTYQPEVVVMQAVSHERLECAQSLWYLHLDYNFDHERPFFMDDALFHASGFSDETAAIGAKLADPTFLQQTLTGLNEFRLAYAEDKTLLRWHYHQPLFLLERMAKLQNEPLSYPVSELPPMEQDFFITQDEVDDAIRGSGNNERSLSIYSFFIHDHSVKEQTAFLKDSYGQGGHSRGVSHADDSFVDYEGKGITFRRGSGEQTCEVKLNWQQYAKRVQGLVLSGHFLTQDMIDQIPDFERSQLVRRIVGFYQQFSWANLPFEAGDYYTNKDKTEALIQTEDGIDSLLSGMMRNLTELDQGDTHFESLMKTYSDLTAYRNGTFSLFIPSAELQAEAEKRGVSLIVHPGRTANKAEMVYLYHESSTIFLNGNSFEVAEITGDSITLRDASFPLSTLTCDRAELDELLRQDSKNDYLLGEQENVEDSEEAIEVVEEPDIPEPVSEIIEPEADDTDDFSAPAAEEIPEIVEAEPTEESSVPALREVVIDLMPQSPAHEPLNFRITDDALGVGGPKEKFRRNLAAIQLVHRLEDEGRMATAEEQTVLAQYVGWGGIPQAFDERNSQWSKEYQQLKAELTPEEYNAARGSTLNAHYTTPEVIREIYAGLERMGFTGGNILEPAMGVGNFFGMLPPSLAGNSKLYGVELDEITGKIAKQLYQKADISVTGFERTHFSNDFFDVVVGNVPFGNYQVADRQYDRHHFMIHDYFLAKSLDKVRPGGVVAVITSSGTMDKKDDSARRYLAERADLLGAVRLPNNAFRRNAGTDVVTDILFLQKREAPRVQMPEWVSLGANQQGFSTNRYFVTHPEMVLGEWTEESTQYGKMEATVKPIEGADLGEQLRQAIGSIKGRIDLTLREDDELTEDVTTIPADPGVRNFSYTVVDGDVFYRENSVMRKVELPAVTAERVRGMVAIRDCTQQLINAQLEDANDTAISDLQGRLNQLYDSFTKKYGLISTQANRRAFANDSSYCLLRSLEVLDNDGNLERKADMFSKRTIKRSKTVDHVDTASEALAVSIADKAAVDLDYMAGLTVRSAEDMIQELQGVIFRDPTTDRWQTADEYLSGNVREKLRMAQAFSANHPEYTVNVEALQRVQPKDLTASEISIRLGAVWIDPDYITQFMGELLHTPGYLLGRQIRAHYSKTSGTWSISGKNSDSFRNVYATKVYGTNAANGYRLLEDCLNLRDTRILRKVYVDGQERTEVDANATMLAQQKQDAIREQFKDWIFRNPQRRAALVREYNERFNSVRPRQYDGSHIRFDGMNPEIKLRKHQLNAVAHILYGHNTLLAHCVGAGKTYEMAAAAMESKRLGLCEKSLFVVPNHLIDVRCS